MSIEDAFKMTLELKVNIDLGLILLKENNQELEVHRR